MRNYGNLESGLGQLVRAFTNGPQLRAAGQQAADQMAVESSTRGAQRDKALAEAVMAGLKQKFLESQAGADPSSALATGYNDYYSGKRTAQDTGYEQNAIDAFKGGQTDLSNVMLAAANRTPYKPYAQTAEGSVLNTATGGIDQSSPIAGATLALRGAQTASNNTAAAANSALAQTRRVALENPKALDPYKFGAELDDARSQWQALYRDPLTGNVKDNSPSLDQFITGEWPRYKGALEALRGGAAAQSTTLPVDIPGVSAPLMHAPSPDQQAAGIKAQYRAGKITREQARAQLAQMSGVAIGP